MTAEVLRKLLVALQADDETWPVVQDWPEFNDAWNALNSAESDPLRQAAAHLAAFDWELLTSPASPDLNARILALRAELTR